MAKITNDPGSRQKVRLPDGSLQILEPDGSFTEVERAGPLEQAWRQTREIGAGVVDLYGRITDQPALRYQAGQYARGIEEEYADTDFLYPLASDVGQAIPGAVVPPYGKGFVNFATNVGIGGLESALDINEPGTMGGRFLAGGVGAAGGDVLGRVVGKAYNISDGLAYDLRHRGHNRDAPLNPLAETYESLGGETLAYQRMGQNQPGAGAAKRFTQAAEAAPNSPRLVQRAVEKNDRMHRNRVLQALGLPTGNYEAFDQRFFDDALKHFDDGFSGVVSVANEASKDAGGLKISAEMADTLRSLPEIAELLKIKTSDKLASLKMGEVPGATYYKITGDDWIQLRSTLSETAADRFAKGRGSAGLEYLDMIDALDNEIGQYVPDRYLEDFARLREQYKVFKILESPHTINRENAQINTNILNRRLTSQAGFGRNARAGRPNVNPATDDLIATMRAADNPLFKAPATSATAENLQGSEIVNDAVQGLTDLAVTGNPAQALGVLGRLTMPAVVGASNMGSGRMFTQGAAPAPIPLREAGKALGRSALDEAFYPFIGSGDDRVEYVTEQ